MNLPKVSVLIPMYNRKQYIEQCIDSVLSQTFQDFELVIRDDCSTDGVFEFVQQKYAKEISSRQIKLKRNKKNLGEHHTENLLFLDAKGKYFAVLHNDDLYLPHALESLYYVAEELSADVVHSCRFFVSPKDGSINQDTKFSLCKDNNSIQEVSIMSNSAEDRFKEYFFANGASLDCQYNLFRKDFILENEIFHPTVEGGHRFFSLQWIMLAKVFVKTPVIFYIHRNSPHNQTNEQNLSYAKISKLISERIELARYLDRILPKITFLEKNEELCHKIKEQAFAIQDEFYLKRRGVFKKEFTKDFRLEIENVFKKYFGVDFFYPMFLFCRSHDLYENSKYPTENN